MGGKLTMARTTAKHTNVSISMEDYSMMRAVWSRIELEPKMHGIGFYTKYFAKYPQYIKYFSDQEKYDVSLDAFLVVKFTVIIEFFGYLILDFYNKPTEFHQLIGHLGMMHKDMDLTEKDTDTFIMTLIDYLKDAVGGLMTENCELVFIAFFRHIQELMLKSIEELRQRFAEEMNEDFAPRSPFKTLVPCFDFRNKLIYGQPKEYWEARQREWKMKIKSWEDDSEMQAPTTAPQNVAESSSSEDDLPERSNKTSKNSETESRKTYINDENQPDLLFMQRARYMTTGVLVSMPHFDQFAPKFSDTSVANEIEESHLISDSEARSAGNVRLTPRERHRAAVVASRSLLPKRSRRMISSTDAGTSARDSGSSARERRRSTWN